MARQVGPLFKSGCIINNLCFYEMDGKYYVRKKSSLTGKKVKTHPGFLLTRVNYKLFGIASKIGSRIYQMFPKTERVHDMYKKFTGEAMKLLKQGIEELEAEQQLVKRFVEKTVEPQRETIKIPSAVDKNEKNKQPVYRKVRILKSLVMGEDIVTWKKRKPYTCLTAYG